MLLALNLRLSRLAIVLIVFVNVILLLIVADYIWCIRQTDFASKLLSWDLNNYFNQNLSPLDRYGYIIEPGNVQLKFTNPNLKSGSKDKILKYNQKIYANTFTDKISEPKDVDIEYIRPPKPEDIGNYEHANATVIALVRNSEVTKIGSSIRAFEKSFNLKFNYPYTFINDQPFTERFKNRIRKYTKAPINYIEIPPELWDKPSNIDIKEESKAMNELEKENIAYAKKPSYHNMCRFYLGNFYNLPELQKYKYYWRLEPSVSFYTDLNYDVFKYLALTGKIYGFTVSLYDIEKTVETLWPETLNFLNEGDNYKYVDENGAFQWLLENQQNPEKNKVTGGYSTCHFWSNFEIGDMDFFRSEAYNEWFKHLDHSGGFYYERWGDAPVHSIGLGLFADKSKIHWFRDIGYFHDPYMNCPNTDSTKNCEVGKFSRWKHLEDQNCMASWIDYSMDDISRIY